MHVSDGGLVAIEPFVPHEASDPGVSSAVNMYEVSQGMSVDLPSAVETLTAAGYLKAVPSNPVSANEPMRVTSTQGSPASGRAPALVLMSLGSEAGAICTAIVRQTGQDPAASSPPTIDPVALPSVASGCFRKRNSTFTFNWMINGNYYAFARV